MDSKLLLVQAITLLYKESLLEDNTSGSGSLVLDVIDTVILPEMSVDTERDRSSLAALRSTAIWMANNRNTTTYDRTELLQRIRINIGNDEIVMRSFEEAFDPESDVDPDKIRDTVRYYRGQFNQYIKQQKLKKVLSGASRKVLFEEDNVNWGEFIDNLRTNLEKLGSFKEKELHQSIVHQISLMDVDKMSEQLELAQTELSPVGALKPGIHALGDMLGNAKGFRRGEFVTLYALQHNFKSGLLMTLFKQICLLNKPVLRDEKKKPMVLFISYENEVNQNIGWLYISLKENDTGEAASISDVSAEEASRYVSERLSVMGWHPEMLRIDPSDFSFQDLFDLIADYEDQGYEIGALLIDYLNKMTKYGCDEGPAGHSIRDLFRRVRNFTSKRGITCITPHQLSTEAKALKRQGVDNFLEEIVGKGYSDGCRTIDQEVDLEIYIDIETVGERSYLNFHRGKHRKMELTPAKYHKFVLPFYDVGAIRDDINGADSRLKYAGQDMTDSGGGEKPWFQL